MIVGRKKIDINYIKDDKLRIVTNSKRKKGLIKKAMEISLLCGTDIVLIIHDKFSKKATMYSNIAIPNVNTITNHFNVDKPLQRYTNDDVLYF